MATTKTDDLHIGMMGDGTEEQNLGQRGNPKARITQDEVEAAFSGAASSVKAKAEQALAGATATVKSKAASAGAKVAAKAAEVEDDVVEAAEDTRSFIDDRWTALKDRAAEVREQVAASADVVRDWAADRADAARQTAAEKPVLVVSLSAATALTLGLAIGFLLGRAVED